MTSLLPKLPYIFESNELLQKALVHPSALKTSAATDFQRCEFLGDRVLGLAIASALYAQFPTAPEGSLAKKHSALVCRETLATIARTIDLGDALKLSAGEQKLGGRQKDSILADAMEAVLGCVFLDGGYKAAEAVIQELWQELLGSIAADAGLDPKSALQEYVQAQGKALPTYDLGSQEGPDHAPHFVMRVQVEGAGSAVGTGHSKKEAARNAAKALLEKLRKDTP